MAPRASEPQSRAAPREAGLFSKVSNALDVVNAGLDIAGGLFGEFNRIRHPRGHEVITGACRKDRHDPRDVHYERHNDIDPSDLPPFVDLREHLTPVEDQGDLGSCTANAIAGAYEYLLKRFTGHHRDVSRLFIYYLEREQEGTVDQDAGASLRDGIKALKDYGVCSEKLWPYNVKAFRHRPPGHAFDEASNHTIDEYHRIPVDLHAMKVCLAEGYPFVFGMKIFKSFEAHGHHGRIQLPRFGEKNLGGHAMLACGYSDQDQVFLVRNSWGDDWGDGGYCYVPYAYLAEADYTHDCWTIRRAHNLDFTQSSGGSILSFFSDSPAFQTADDLLNSLEEDPPVPDDEDEIPEDEEDEDEDLDEDEDEDLDEDEDEDEDLDEDEESDEDEDLDEDEDEDEDDFDDEDEESDEDE